MHNVIIVPNGRSLQEKDLDGESTVCANLHNGLSLLIEPPSRSCPACRKKRLRCVHEEGRSCYTCRSSTGCPYGRESQAGQSQPSSGSKRKRGSAPTGPYIPYDSYPRLLPYILGTSPVKREEPRSPSKRRKIEPQSDTQTAVTSPKSVKRKSSVRVLSSPSMSPDPLIVVSPRGPSRPKQGASSSRPQPSSGSPESLLGLGEAHPIDGDGPDDVSIKSSSSTRGASVVGPIVPTPVIELSLHELSGRLSDTMAFITRIEPIAEAARKHLWSLGELTEWCDAGPKRIRADLPHDVNIAWGTFRQGHGELMQALEKAKGEAKGLMETMKKRL